MLTPSQERTKSQRKKRSKSLSDLGAYCYCLLTEENSEKRLTPKTLKLFNKTVCIAFVENGLIKL
jgi:hypothetical protein